VASQEDSLAMAVVAPPTRGFAGAAAVSMEDAVDVVGNTRKGALTIRVDAHQRDCERACWHAAVLVAGGLGRRHRPFGHEASAWIFKVPEIGPWVVAAVMLWPAGEPFLDCSSMLSTVAWICCMVRRQAAC
jgi:hypothetical protein